MSSDVNTEWIAADYTQEDKSVVKPIFWPLILQGVLLISSASLFFMASVDQHLTFGLIGYFLTPFFVVALLALLRAQDLKNRALSNYDRALGRKYILISGLLALASFIVAIPIIWRIAIEIAQVLGAMQ